MDNEKGWTCGDRHSLLPSGTGWAHPHKNQTPYVPLLAGA